jgi:aspartyl-tRNA(Asn)/glutamyl-tRNA(Gln) amidotransferase subunit C
MNSDDVLKIAHLARLEIKDTDTSKFLSHFEILLNHFEELKDINTEKIQPLFHFQEQMILRDDISENPLNPKDFLQNAPDTFENSFKIPKIVGVMES